MRTSKTQLRKPMDLNEWAYITIKEMILKNEYTAGEQIHIEELTKTLQVSRTPVREALLRLQADGLVDVFPHVGYFVRGISRTDFHDVFELRCLIECYTAEHAAITMSDEQVKMLKEIHACSTREIEADNLDAFNQYEIEFHNSLITHSGNQQIIKVMANISDQIIRGRIIALKSQENVRLSNQEHLKIIRAIEIHNPKKANIAMAEHIQRVEARLCNLIDFTDAKPTE